MNSWILRHLTVFLLVFTALHHHPVTSETLANTTVAPSPTSLISPSPSLSSSTTTNNSSSTRSSTQTSSTSSSSSSHVPTPTHIGLSYVKKGCLYLNATGMNFSYDSLKYISTNLSHLAVLYKNHTDNIEGCEDKKSRVFTRNYFDSNKSKNIRFWFKLSFEYNMQGDSWSLTSLDSGNRSHGNSSFYYGSCGYNILVPLGMYYRCSLLMCNGQERVDTTKSTITFKEFVAEVFYQKDRTTLSKDYSQCGSQSSENNDWVFVIVGLVIGITLSLALIIIIVSFLYKRYRYGPYNLLD